MIVPVALKHLSHVAANEEGRYAICGIFIKRVSVGVLEACATNGQAIVKIQIEEPSEKKEKFAERFNGKCGQKEKDEGAIYSTSRLRKALDETKSGHRTQQSGWLLVEETDNKLSAMSHTFNEDAQSIAKVHGIFPKYDSIFPKETPEDKEITFKVDQLENLLRCIKGLGGRTVTFRIGKTGFPAVIKAKDLCDTDLKLTAAIMPQKI